MYSITYRFSSTQKRLFNFIWMMMTVCLWWW